MGKCGVAGNPREKIFRSAFMDDVQESSSIPSTKAQNDTLASHSFALLGAGVIANVKDPNEPRVLDSFLMILSLDEKHFSTNYPFEFLKATVASSQRVLPRESISLCFETGVGNHNKCSPALISEVHDNSRSKLAPMNINKAHPKETKLPSKLKCLSLNLRKKAFDQIDKACGFSEWNEQHIRFRIPRTNRQKELLFNKQHGRIRPEEYQFVHRSVGSMLCADSKPAPDRITDEVQHRCLESTLRRSRKLALSYDKNFSIKREQGHPSPYLGASVRFEARVTEIAHRTHSQSSESETDQTGLYQNELQGTERALLTPHAEEV